MWIGVDAELVVNGSGERGCDEREKHDDRAERAEGGQSQAGRGGDHEPGRPSEPRHPLAAPASGIHGDGACHGGEPRGHDAEDPDQD